MRLAALLLLCFPAFSAELTEGTAVKDDSGDVVSLDLTSTWVTDADLAKVGRMAQLRALNLSHTKVTDAGLGHLGPLQNVTDLNCYYAEYITDTGIAHLKGWKKLEHLNLRGTKVTSRVFEHLSQLTSLKSLDVAFTDVDDEGFEQLASLPGLEKLAMGGNRLSGAALPLLELIPSLTQLDAGGIQRVDSGLWGLALTDNNLEHIGALTRLEVLSLSGANLADRGLDRPGSALAERSELRDLSKLRTLVNLHTLDLSHTPVSPKALEPIAELPKLRELRLGLAHNIDDTAVPVLLAMEQLESLVLTETAITDQGLDQLRGMKQLKRLSVGGTKVSASAVERFRRERSECEVSWF